MRTRALLLLAAIATTGMLSSHGAEPSAGCAGGEVPPTTGDGGVGLDHRGVPPGSTPAAVSLTACNTGKNVPPPAKGAATLVLDVHVHAVSVDVDGDSANAAPAPAKACTDGFARVVIDAKGPHFYQAPNGNFADTDPKKKGNQPAKEQTAQQWAESIKANCAG